MAQDVAAQLMGKFINNETYEAVPENGGCYVEFFMEALPDPLLTEGGEIEKKHPKVKEIRKLEQEALALLRGNEPFTEAEPQPPKDQTPAVQRAYQQAHEEWDARRVAHDEDLKARASLLKEHHEHKDLLVVSPAGRPIYIDTEFIRIFTPGDKDNIPVRPVRPSDIAAYRDQYNRFKNGLSQAATGTPLEQWPGLNKSQVKELAYFNIRTVEQLAQTSDASIQKIGPFMAHRKRAQDYLATARGMAPVEEARAEAKRARDEIAELKRQIEGLRNQKQGNQAQR